MANVFQSLAAGTYSCATFSQKKRLLRRTTIESDMLLPFGLVYVKIFVFPTAVKPPTNHKNRPK